MKPSEQFHSWLTRLKGPARIGQVVIVPGYTLRHVDDLQRGDCRKIADLGQWHDLIRFDASGAYRPLKAAPNLPGGWEFGPLNFAGLVVALDYLYPGAIANWALAVQNRLRVVPYAETAGRQTGRFAIVKTLDPQSCAELTAQVCTTGCLKRRLWSGVDEKINFQDGGSEIPLLCPETCNYFISKAREKIKGPMDGD